MGIIITRKVGDSNYADLIAKFDSEVWLNSSESQREGYKFTDRENACQCKVFNFSRQQYRELTMKDVIFPVTAVVLKEKAFKKHPTHESLNINKNPSWEVVQVIRMDPDTSSFINGKKRNSRGSKVKTWQDYFTEMCDVILEFPTDLNLDISCGDMVFTY